MIDGLTPVEGAVEVDFGRRSAELFAQLHELDAMSVTSANKTAAQETALQQQKINNLKTLIELKKQKLEEAAQFEADLETKHRTDAAKLEIEAEKKRQDLILVLYEQQLAEKERLYKKSGKVVSEIEKAELRERLLTDKKLEEQAYKAAAAEEEKRKKEAAKKRKADGKTQSVERFNEIFAAGATPKERLSAVKNIAKGPDGQNSFKAFVGNMTAGLANLAKQLESKMDEIGKHKAGVDTRLYGSGSNATRFGSYYDQITKDFTSAAGASPFILQADLVSSLETLVQKGISQNVQQRAFLMTVTDKVAATFEAADGTLLKLVRIQQKDSTASRMGMEAALNAFLNNMYETTEYLSDLASSVRSNIYEAQALMDAERATEFEFQVQKWMGSMYSVGMSDSAVSAISTALGQLAAGEIEAVTNGGAGNLLVMAANAAGMSIGEILNKGLDSDTTNELLNAAVEYLGNIAQQSDSKVIQQQLAGVFGVKASDLKAIMNLKTDSSGASSESTLNSIFNKSLTNEEMYRELANRMGTMYQRVGIGEMMSNVWDNMQYSMAAGMANNPITYLLYKVGGLLEQTTGGIDLPFLNVYGFGVDMNTSVAQLMQAGAMSAGILGSIGGMVSSLASTFSGDAMLNLMDISSGTTVVRRGLGDTSGNRAVTGATFSESGTVTANGSASDVENSTMAGATDESNAMLTKGTEEFDKDATRQDEIDNYNEGNGKLIDATNRVGDSLDQLVSLVATSTGQGINGGLSSNPGVNNNFGVV